MSNLSVDLRHARLRPACCVILTCTAPAMAQSAAAPAPSTQAASPVASAAPTPAPAETTPAAASPFKLDGFVDAYAAWQTSGPGTLATLSGHRAFAGQGATLRAENGFSLAFAGLDVSYDTGRFGALVNVRFGEAIRIFHYNDGDLPFGVDYLTQAYVLWRPAPQLELDLGMFLSPYGVESLESWKNPNYTLSALYTYGQPSWHTGLKATWQLDEAFSLMGVVVNGSNNISETQQNDGLDQSLNLGASLTYAPGEVLSLAFGGLVATDNKHNDDAGIDAFLDFVATLEKGPWLVAFNADYIFTRDGAPDGGDRHFWGGSLTAGYRLTEAVGLAARGEYLRYDANYGQADLWKLVTATLTLDVEPVPGFPNFILRWENRWEHSNQRIFGKNGRGTTDTADDSYSRDWFESVLGAVVTTSL